MRDPAVFRRTLAAVGLVSAALLTALSVVLAPEFSGDFTSRLAAIDAGGTSSTVSAVAFTLSQLPLIAGLLGIGHLLRERSPVMSSLGTSLGLVGAFGHSVYGGIAMVQLAMAADAAHRSIHAETLAAVEAGPAVAFMAMGLVGTVLGILLLSIGLWRARVQPRWAAPTLGAFLVVEFVGTSLSDRAGQVAALLYVAALVGLAVTIWRSPRAAWTTPLATEEPALVSQPR